MLKKLLFAVVALSIVLISFASAFIVPVQSSQHIEAADPPISYPIAIPVLVIKYFPTADNVTINTVVTATDIPAGTTIAQKRATTNTLDAGLLANLGKGSTYHGYKNPLTTPSLNYSIVGEIEYLAEVPKVAGSSIGLVDYYKIMNDINISDWVNNHGVKEVWIWGYEGNSNYPLRLWESNFASTWGDISNSNRDPNDLPIIPNKSYTVYHYNYGRDLGCALEDHGHQIEAILNWVEDGNFSSYKAKSIANGTNFSNFTYEADVSMYANGNSGLIFRVSNSFQDDNGYNGYYANIDVNGDWVMVGKSTGSVGQEIQKVSTSLIPNTKYHMKVIANGPSIKVYVDDMVTPKIQISDSTYSTGSIGVRTWQADAKFDNISVVAGTASFTDDFNDGNANDWTTYGGAWAVTDGQYTVGQVNRLFWGKFVGRDQYNKIYPPVSACGWTHSPPNTEKDYDWYNSSPVLSDCESWNPDRTGERKLVSCSTWSSYFNLSGCDDSSIGGTGTAFKIWWMQNFPGKEANLYYQGNKLRNWWDFIGNFDQAMLVGRSLTYTTNTTNYLTISSSSGGTVTTPGLGNFSYIPGTYVSLVATPNAGYNFVNWTGTGVTAGKVANTNSSTTTITMDGNYSVQAHFTVNSTSGSGTASDPYIIHTVEDLQNIELNLSAYYELGNDIDASATTGWNGGVGFIPITNFTGSLDGKGYTVDGLYENTTAINANVFTNILSGAIVKDIYFTGLDIHANSYYGAYAAGLCFENHGTILRCSVEGSAEANQAAAGFCHNNHGDISNCYSLVSSTGPSYADGFCRLNSGTITNCYAAATISCPDSNGFCRATAIGGVITSCYWDTQVSGIPSSGGGGTGKTTAEMKQQATFVGWDFTTTPIWQINEGVSYPTLTGITINYTLTASSSVGGAVTTPGEGIFGPYSASEVVNLVATPAPSYYFVNWTGSGVTAGKVANPNSPSTTILMDGNYSVQANFRGLSWSAVTSGTTVQLNEIWGSSPSNIFAVGASGTIRNYNGNAWSKMTSGITSLFPPSLNSVWGLSPSNVFAVGASGTIRKYNGTSWSAMTSGTTAQLNSVWGSSSSNVFAVGALGTIRYYNGTSWSAMTSGTTKNLNGVWGTGANDVFAVGDSGTVLHYNGTAWSTMNSTITTALYSIWGSSFDNVFAIGASGKIIQYK